MPTTPKFTIPFNIPLSAVLIAEQLHGDGSCEYLVREGRCDKSMTVSREIFDRFACADIRPGDRFEIMKIATEDGDGFHSHVVVRKVETGISEFSSASHHGKETQ